jgi:P-type E1-E2 ATPase
MVPLVFVINGITKNDWKEAFFSALAVAVGLTPEMLPMIVSVCLAKGALAMSKEKVIVKKLNSIQNFGAMDVPCTDKTGTLTIDRVILELHVDVFKNESEFLSSNPEQADNERKSNHACLVLLRRRRGRALRRASSLHETCRRQN